VHFLRNALAYANKGQRQMVFALINTIFAQESADLAHKQWRIVTDQLREKFPKLATMMEAAENEVLSFMEFPKEHRVKIHSTNVLERLNGEVKRRSDVVGIFPNERAIRRLVGALLLEQNDEYTIQKRYMGVESMAQLSENPAIRLPAAPALA
jgi:putative transposase